MFNVKELIYIYYVYSCHCLSLLQADESSTKIEYLQKAHLIAKEGRHTYQEGLASHRLGCAYETIQDYDTAIQVN